MKVSLLLLTAIVTATLTTHAQDCQLHPPVSLHLTNVTSCSATLSWQSAGDVSKFIVSYKLSASSQWSQTLNTGTNTTYTFTGLLPGHHYDFSVRAKCTDGSVSKKKVKQGTTLKCSLPDQVAVTAENAHSVKIAVTTACDYDSLHVRYHSQNGPQVIVTYPADDAYFVNGLNFDSTYIFQVSTCPLNITKWSAPVTVTLPKPPNIILMIVDDSRDDYFSIDGAFPFIHTPNIDRIGNEGVNFKRTFVATSLCSPSRATMATGLFTLKTGITENGLELDSSFLTVPEVLGAQGYYTALVGKNHGVFLNGDIPEFDYYLISIMEGTYDGTYYDYNGTEKIIDKANVLTETDSAIALIERVNQPLFMWMGWRQPHYPEMPLPEFEGIYDNYVLPWKPDTARYTINYPSYLYARGGNTQIHGIELDTTRKSLMEVIAGLDSCIGLIFNTLETTGKLDNTMIIFISDNGHMMGSHWLNEKTHAYEPSMRVPLLVRYPSWFTPGTVIKDEFASNLDIAPTIYDAAQVNYNGPTMDGRSLRDLYDGTFSRKQAYFLELQNPGAASPTKRCIRDENYKYIHYSCNSDTVEEFFDMIHDSLEMTNLVNNSAYASIIETYRAKYEEARIEWGDTIEGPIKNCFILNPVNLKEELNDEADYPKFPFVYPTITTRSLEIYLPWSTAELVLTDAMGNYISHWKISETFTHLTLPVLADGMYYLRFSDHDKSVTRKIVISGN